MRQRNQTGRRRNLDRKQKQVVKGDVSEQDKSANYITMAKEMMIFFNIP